MYYNFWTGQAYFRGVTVDKNALGRLAMLKRVVFGLEPGQLSDLPDGFERSRTDCLRHSYC